MSCPETKIQLYVYAFVCFNDTLDNFVGYVVNRAS